MVSKHLDAERHGFFIMKEIPLSRGLFALVDDEDYDMLIKHVWNANGGTDRYTLYARRYDYSGEKRKLVRMHRFILGVTDPKILVDHKDGNGLNNQKSNIRICTPSQNQANRPKRKFSVAKYKGITKALTVKSGWRAQIKIDGKVVGLGTYDSQIEAAIAYDKSAKIVHGEFAYLNFPD